MIIKLLCIDPLEDYEIIDKNLLTTYGIDPIYVYKFSNQKKPFNNSVFIDSFCEEEIYKICRLVQPTFIVCSSESLFIALAQIRAALNIKGMALSKAKLLSHKNLMYEQLQDQFPYPKTTNITKDLSFSDLREKVESSEIFIKPINMAGSRETYHVKNNNDYQFFLLQQQIGLENYIAQAYIDAELYHSELVIFKGEILFSSARKYSLPNHLMISGAKPIFSLNIQDPNKHQKIIESSIKIKELLKIDNGILHTEFFLKENGALYFIETNARAPGIGLNRMYRKKLSISLETILCFIVCGICPPPIIEQQNDKYFCGYFPLKPGRVKKINIPSLDVENEWITYVKPNDHIERVKHMSKSAMVICWDTNIERLQKVGHLLDEHNLIEVY